MPSLCFDATPCLLRGARGPSVTSACKAVLKHLSLGKNFPPPAKWVMRLVWQTTGIVCSPALKNKSQSGLVKNQERQQCCDNPRVKGVNMWREFHAWQVRRMAPVFSLFTHANEQYADEQTWVQPRLPAAQNWHKACCCGSAAYSCIPCVL